MKLSDYKFGTKLGAAFGFMTLLTLAVGSVAIVELSRINANTEEIATNWLPSVRVLGELRVATNRFRREQGELLLATDDTEVRTVNLRLDAAQNRIAEEQAVYEPLISSPEEKEAYDQYRQHLATFMANHAKLKALAAAGARNQEEARTQIRGALTSNYSSLAADLDQLVKMNDQGASAAYSAAQATYARGRLLMICLLTAATALAALLAVLITRTTTPNLPTDVIQSPSR